MNVTIRNVYHASANGLQAVLSASLVLVFCTQVAFMLFCTNLPYGHLPSAETTTDAGGYTLGTGQAATSGIAPVTAGQAGIANQPGRELRQQPRRDAFITKFNAFVTFIIFPQTQPLSLIYE